MKTITMNGKELKITAPMERALRLIAKNKVILQSDLAEGRGHNIHYAANIDLLPGVEKISLKNNDFMLDRAPKFVRNFASKHPRAQAALYDDRGKVARIVRKLDRA